MPATLYLFARRVRIVAGRYEAEHPWKFAAHESSSLAEHRAAMVAAVPGKRGKRYLKRQQLLELGERAIRYLTEIVHRPYLDGVLQLDPKNGEAWKYKGIVKVDELRANKAKLSREQEQALIEEAKSDLLKAEAFGQNDASTQGLLAGLYVASGDEVNAEKHLSQACGMNPQAAICAKP